jgi:organic hydroperoxide reductase OsmC/OhrA
MLSVAGKVEYSTSVDSSRKFGFSGGKTPVTTHRFELTVQWDSVAGEASSARDRVRRRHTVSHPGKADIEGSSAPAFFGEAERWNPEELLLAALSQCHMLTFFYLASQEGLTITDYVDTPEAVLDTNTDGSGNISEVTLKPRLSIQAGFTGSLEALHQRASELCFIARSVNFPVRHDPPPVTIT